jgi:hypothetical protein
MRFKNWERERESERGREGERAKKYEIFFES